MAVRAIYDGLDITGTSTMVGLVVGIVSRGAAAAATAQTEELASSTKKIADQINEKT